MLGFKPTALYCISPPRINGTTDTSTTRSPSACVTVSGIVLERSPERDCCVTTSNDTSNISVVVVSVLRVPQSTSTVSVLVVDPTTVSLRLTPVTFVCQLFQELFQAESVNQLSMLPSKFTNTSGIVSVSTQKSVSGARDIVPLHANTL